MTFRVVKLVGMTSRWRIVFILILVLCGCSAPALSSRAATKTPLRTSSDDVSSRSPWKASNGEFSHQALLDDNSSFGVAAPFFKSVMQVFVSYANVFRPAFFFVHLYRDFQNGRLLYRIMQPLFWEFWESVLLIRKSLSYLFLGVWVGFGRGYWDGCCVT